MPKGETVCTGSMTGEASARGEKGKTNTVTPSKKASNMRSHSGFGCEGESCDLHGSAVFLKIKGNLRQRPKRTRKEEWRGWRPSRIQKLLQLKPTMGAAIVKQVADRETKSRARGYGFR